MTTTDTDRIAELERKLDTMSEQLEFRRGGASRAEPSP